MPVPNSGNRPTASSGVGPLGATRCTLGQNSPVSLSRISWLVTVVGFLVAALLLVLNGYVGYFLVLLAVAAAAAVNLVR